MLNKFDSRVVGSNVSKRLKLVSFKHRPIFESQVAIAVICKCEYVPLVHCKQSVQSSQFNPEIQASGDPGGHYGKHRQ